jgi:Na+/phosphate symporter
MTEKKYDKPILMVVAGFVAGVLVTFLSLGVLTPLGAVLFGLSLVLAGLWILTHTQHKWAQLLGITLMVSPFFIILAFFIRFVRTSL